MASQEQIAQILTLVQQQMSQLQSLQSENSQLRAANADSTTAPITKTKTKAPDRPVINTDTDAREWELFKDSWSRYKIMTAITDPNFVRMELRAACSQDVNRLLFEYVGSESLNVASEDELLDHIKSVAVKETHKEVHRMNFFRLSQMEGETVTQYVARLRSHAVLCQFKIACTEHLRQIFINYTDDMVTQQLISGLRNQNHQSRILSEAAALPTLQQKIDRLQCLESTEQSTGLLQSATPTPPSNNNAIKSGYRRRQNQQQSTRTPCKGCGGLSHEGKTMARKDCPAINKNCGYCGIKGHFQAVCKKKLTNPSQSKAATEPPQAETEPEQEASEASTAFAFGTQDFRLAPNPIGHQPTQ